MEACTIELQMLPRLFRKCQFRSQVQCAPFAGRNGRHLSAIRFRRRSRCGSAGAPCPSGGGTPGGAAEEAFSVAQQCIELFTTGSKDAILDFLPEAVIDRCIEHRRKRSSRGADAGVADLSFEDLLSVANTADFQVDAFAQRGLIVAAPAAARMLSMLRLSPERCLQRYEVVAASGEEMVLVLEMVLEDALEPRYRSVQFVKRWFLRGITGEPAASELPLGPARQHSPESVVMAQLDALRCEDAGGVFTFASPANQAAFAGEVAAFAEMLGSDPYRPLLGHLAAEVLQSAQLAAGKCFVLVGVTPASVIGSGGVPQKMVYSWVLGLQAVGEMTGCWMTEAVLPVSTGGMSMP